jgi:hypothetical protein
MQQHVVLPHPAWLKISLYHRIGCFEGIEPAKKVAQPEETGHFFHERTGGRFQKGRIKKQSNTRDNPRSAKKSRNDKK